MGINRIGFIYAVKFLLQFDWSKAIITA